MFVSLFFFGVCACVCMILIRDFGAFCSLINVSVPNYGVCCLYFE